MQVNSTIQTHIKLMTLKTLLTTFSIILLFIGTGFNLKAQVPGYLGKRFLIGVELPMVAGLDIKKDDFRYKVKNNSGGFDRVNKDYFFLYYKVKPTINLEYVVNRKSSIQAFARFFSSTIDISPFTDTVGVNGNEQTFYPSERAKTKTRSFGLKYRLFRGDGLSPVGRYLSFGIEYSTNKFELSDDLFNSDDGWKIISKEPQNNSVSTVVLTYGFGTQHPLGKSLILNIGGELGLPFSVFWLNYSSDEGYNIPSSEDWAKFNSKNNFFRSYIFNITVGLALIP